MDIRTEAKTMEVLRMERERLNEKKYRDLYRTLLSKHAGIFQNKNNNKAPNHRSDDSDNNKQEGYEHATTTTAASSSSSAYQEETDLLRKAIISERNASLWDWSWGWRRG